MPYTREELANDMKNGFKGIHDRQDITNGRIGKLENWKNFMVGGMSVLSVFIIPLFYGYMKGDFSTVNAQSMKEKDKDLLKKEILEELNITFEKEQ